MQLQVLASGSGGNAALVRAGELALLLDAGLPIDALEQRLAAARLPPHRLDAIVLTHGHLDHARSAGLLARKSGARVYCSVGLLANASLRGARATCALPAGGRVTVRAARGGDELALATVPLPHDADPTFALVLEHGGRRLALCTDLGAADPAVGRALAGVHVLALEFNHDAELLARGPYTPALKRRVGGPRGHLSNAQAAELLALALAPELHTLVLVHLSATNNRPELALASAQGVLERAGRTDVRLVVAEQERIGAALAV
ncbi:MAG TPA: MBL fold metallo-hydrolase [Planctomycetota bacterium]